ncbi:hypothetical protein EZV62_014907 [Acer yangbiense]|uniref:Uncharacterized protein n=1 Tax=Acer yangbiense TaxID=1000413 RepID=A0A5C7HU59_9ROSI|nr:hypothetical protein EZV62_014907 [Acer yangbiense]
MDDFSLKVGVYFMKEKIEVFEKFKEWHHKKFHCEEIYSTNVVKRINRTLLERSRCIRLHTRFPESFWAEAVIHACYLGNWSPLKLLEFKLAKVWTGKNVDYSNLKIFGWKTYAFVPSNEINKLQSKSLECIFPGFEKLVKGFKLYDMANKKKILNRDVVFDETTMPKEEVNKNDAYGRPMRVSKPQRYGWDDENNEAHFALMASEGDLTTFHEAIGCRDGESWVKGYDEGDGISRKRKKTPFWMNHTSIRVVLALVAQYDMELEQLDVKTTFLHGDLEEVIFMAQLEGFKESRKENLVCRLKKSLYGFKQSLRQWYNDLVVDDLGAAKKILDMEIKRDWKARKLWLSQNRKIGYLMALWKLEQIVSLSKCRLGGPRQSGSNNVPSLQYDGILN